MKTIIPFLLIIVIVFGSSTYDNAYNKALQYLEVKDYSNCITQLKIAVSIKPSEIEPNQLLGTVSCLVEDYSTCVKYLEVATRLDKFRSVAFVSNYLVGLREIGNYDLAIKIGEEIFPRNNQNANIALILGTIYTRKGNMEKAEEFYRKSIIIDPTQVECWRKLLDFYYKNMRPMSPFSPMPQFSPTHFGVSSDSIIENQ